MTIKEWLDDYIDKKQALHQSSRYNSEISILEDFKKSIFLLDNIEEVALEVGVTEIAIEYKEKREYVRHSFFYRGFEIIELRGEKK